MKVYCVQFDIAWEQKFRNFDKIIEVVGSAEPEPGSLIVLPEMFATGFSMNVAAVTDDEKEVTGRFLAMIAKEWKVFIVGGLVTSTNDKRGLNQAAVLDPTGREVLRYTKMQPFTPGGESEHYNAGQDVALFDWGGFRVAPFICYDLRFPELFRLAVHRGANMYAVIANWPATRASHWVSLLQARAIENQSYAVGVNRCGRDPSLTYSGQSMVVAPSGEILVEAGDVECAIACDVSVETVTDYRTRLPFLADAKRAARLTDS